MIPLAIRSRASKRAARSHKIMLRAREVERRCACGERARPGQYDCHSCHRADMRRRRPRKTEPCFIPQHVECHVTHALAGLLSEVA